MKNLKRFFSFLLAASMLLALSVTAFAMEFSDVPADADYAGAVQWASDHGYVNGYGDGRFGTDDSVTRAQLAAILYRAAGSPAASGTSRFPDVAAATYYTDAASWAEDNGLINGYPDGTFGVNDPVTRQQVATILWRWAGSPDASAEDYADESSITDYARTAVDWSRSNSIIAARSDNHFAPGDNATRIEIVSALYNYMGQNDSPSAPVEPNGSKVLVVYFSASNNTEAVAGYIADALNAEQFEIVPAQPYTAADLDWTNSGSRVNAEHNDSSLRNVELVSNTVENWDEYDTVLIGYPIWWGIAAWPVDSFVKANDFTGKTVIPFCTSASSGLGQSGELLAELAGSGNWLEGRRFRSGASEAEVQEWVLGLDLSNLQKENTQN